MPSWVQIANHGLRQVGDDQITDLSQNSEAARAMSDVLPIVRDRILAGHPWNCALKRIRLTKDTVGPDWGYANSFTLPVDCLRVWRLAETNIEYRVESGKLLTNADGPLYVLYISRIDDPEKLSPHLAEALGLGWAAAVTFRLTQSRSAVRDITQLHQLALTEARTIDGQEGTPESIEADEFLSARY